MRACRLVEPGRAEHEEVPTAKPGPGEVVVRVAGARHADPHLLDGSAEQLAPMAKAANVDEHLRDGALSGRAVLDPLAWHHRTLLDEAP